MHSVRNKHTQTPCERKKNRNCIGEKIRVTSDAHQIDSLIVTPIVALPMLFTLMIVVLAKPVKKDDLGDDL